MDASAKVLFSQLDKDFDGYLLTLLSLYQYISFLYSTLSIFSTLVLISICCRYLSDIELLPIIGKVHPSGHYYATKQAEYLMSQVLNLTLPQLHCSC